MVLYAFLEMLGDARHQIELKFVRAIDANFRSGHHLRHARELRRERLAGFRNDFDQAAGRVERVVVAAVAIAEEHVAGHFARQFGVLFLHFGFDERVAGLVHDAVAAQFGDLVVHHLRTFHFADEGGAGLALQDFARVDEQQQIAIDHVAVFVDSADAIGIAIEGEPKLCAGFADLRDQAERDWREPWDRDDGSGKWPSISKNSSVASTLIFSKYAMDHRARRAVARVGDHLDAAIEMELRRHLVHVGRDGVGGRQAFRCRFRNRRAG